MQASVLGRDTHRKYEEAFEGNFSRAYWRRAELIKLKRVYEKREPTDGKRILVDRLWPRGLRKEDAYIDEWLKDIAPSDSLRKWYGHKEARWEEFRKRYREELNEEQKVKALQKLRREGRHQTLTLLFGARDSKHNNAAVLSELLKKAK